MMRKTYFLLQGIIAPSNKWLDARGGSVSTGSGSDPIIAKLACRSGRYRSRY
jgi:hypothetical protein